MASLKILLVSEHFPPDVKGGGELSAELLARNLVSAGHEVHVLTSGDGTTSDSNELVVHRILRTAPHTSISGNFRRMFILPRQISEEVRRLHAEHNFDVIHYLNVVSILGSLPGMKNQFATINSHQPFCPKGNLFYKECEPCTGCTPLKSVGCLINSDYVGKMKVSRIQRLNPVFFTTLYMNYLRYHRTLRNVQPIAVSTYVSEQLASIGFPDAPVIPNFPPELLVRERRLKKEGGKVKLLFLGALEKIKGVGMLLEAFDSLPLQIRSKTALQIVGDGSLRQELQKMAPEGVEFLGQVDSQCAQQLIAECDIVVLPSLWPEPLSRVLLEATSLGKPVVATNVGGNADVVSENEGGVLSAPNPDAFSKCIEQLITDSKKKRMLGTRGKKKHLAKFSTERILRKLDSLYRKPID